MNYKVIAVPRFKKELKKLVKKYHSLKDEFAALLDSLETDPTNGKPLGNNCYKIRLSIKSKKKKNKSGTVSIQIIQKQAG